MKLRLPNKLQAALIAALASVSFTTLSTGTIAVATGAALLAGQQAQADVIQASDTLNTQKSLADYTGQALTLGSMSYTNSNSNSNQKSIDNSVFAPDIKINGADGWWKLTFTLKNNTADAITLNSLQLDMTMYNAGGGNQNPVTVRSTHLILAQGETNLYDENIVMYTVTDSRLNGNLVYDLPNQRETGEKPVLTLGEGGITLASGASQMFTLTAKRSDIRTGYNNIDAGCFFGLKDMVVNYSYEVEGIPTWNGTEGNSAWSSESAWLNGIPTSSTPVVFNDNAASHTVNIDTAATAGAVTVSGQNYTFNLADGGSLTASSLTVTSDSLSLTGAGNVTAGSISASGKTINIGQGVVLQGGATAAATLAGTGTYVLASGTKTLGSISLGSDWTGYVRLSGVSFSNDNIDSLARNGDAGVEMAGITGGYAANWSGGTVHADIRLTNPNGTNDNIAWKWSDGTTADNATYPTVTFDGTWNGSGTFRLTEKRQCVTFSGNISGWDGAFDYRGQHGTKLTFTGNATTVNAAILNNGTNDASKAWKQFHLIVDNNAAFSKAVGAYTLDITANHTATFGGTTNIANGVTLNSGSTLVNTGTMTLDGTIVFGENSIQNNGSGTINFGSNIHFNITNLASTELEGVTTYTLFSGSNAVDLHGFNTTHITVAGGTAGKEWTFGEDGTISFQLSRSVEWNNGDHTGLWNYTDANWSEGRKFQPSMIANFFTNADATVSENVVAGGIVVGQADADAPTVTIAAEGGSTLTAGALDVVKGTLTTNTALLGLESVNIASGTTWNINADQTLGAGAYAGVISVGAGHTVTLSDAGNASSLLKGISGAGNITLTVNTDLEGTTDAANPVRTQAGGTLTIDGARLRVGYLATDSQYIKKYVDMTSFDEVELKNNATLWLQAHQSEFNDVKVSSNSTIHIEDSEGRGTSNVDTLKVTGTMTLNANLTLETRWKGKVNIAALAGTGQLTLTGNELVSLGDGTVGSLKLDNNNTQTVVTGDLTVSSGDLTLSHGTLDVAGSVTVNKTLDLSVGGGSNATLNIKGGGTVTLANTGNASFWGDDGSHLNLEEGGTLALDKYGLSITGLAGGGSVTFPNNTQYGIDKDGITITGANVTVTAAGTGAVTIGNKLTNSKLTTGSHAVTLSHAEDSLIGLTISNGGSFTLNNTNLVDIANVQIENGGTLVTGAANLLGDSYTVTEGATVDLQGHRHTMTTLTLNGGTATTTHHAEDGCISGTIAINAGGTFKVLGQNDAFGYNSGVCTTKIVMQGEDSNLATLALNQNTDSSVTMRTNIEMKGYSAITTTRSGFNTWGGGSITVTGIENTIEKFQIRNNATINVVGAADTLSVGVMALGADSGKELTKTGAGTLTFTEGAAANGFKMNGGTTVFGADGTVAITNAITQTAGAVVSKGTATLGALNLQGGSYTVEAGSTTVTGLTTMTNSATLANAGQLTLNSLTMGTANTLTNTGALQLNGTVLFGTAGIANNGTGSVAFADDIIFNISQLQEGEGHTYTLFTGDSAVDLTALTATAADHITGVTVTGRAWTFSNNGQLSYEILSRDLVWNGGAGTWTTDTETTPWHVDGSEEPVSFATGDAARFAASGTPAEVTLGSNITAVGITVDAGATVAVTPEGHTLSADVANIDGVLTSALATHSVTIGESGVWNMAGGTLNVADVSISNAGLIRLMDGAKVTATKDNVSTLGAVSAEGTGTLEVGGTGAYTFAGQESDPFAGRLIYNIGSTGGHDSSIRLSNFEGTLEIRGRVNYSNSQFGNMSKLVFNGDRSSNTTGLWNTGVANIGVDLDIIGDQLVDFYASNTINVNGNINAAGVQGHLGKENDQTMNLNGITNLLSLRVKNGTVNLKDGTIGTVVVNGGKTVNFNGALTVTDSLEANVNTNLTVGAEGVLDIAGISVAGTAQGTTITTSANNSVYSLVNESYTITNAGITAKQDVEIANRLSNSMVYTDDKAVTLSNIGNVVAGATVGLGSFGMTGGTLSNAITNAGTVSLTEVTLGDGFSQVAEDVHFDLNGDVVTDMNANYYLGVEQYVQVVNGGTITGGSTARWADHSYGVQANGRIILEEALADYTTYFIQSGDVSVGEVLDHQGQTLNFIVSGGTLNIDGEYNELNIKVTDSGTIKGYTAPKDVTIVPEAEVTFEQGIEDTDNGVTFSSGKGGVVVKNTDGPVGGEDFEYTIDQTSAKVTADVLTVDSANDVTIANQLYVTTIENLAANDKSTLELTHSSAAENVERVRAIRGDIAFVNVEEEASINLKELTIGTGKTVGFNTSADVSYEPNEATVVIAAATAPGEGDGGVLNVLEGATLNADLIMEAGSTLDVSYAQDSYGLIMGSSVTLKEGVLLKDSLNDMPSEDMNTFLFGYLSHNDYYFLYNDVEEFYIEQGGTTQQVYELKFTDWRHFDLDASRIFTELNENTYALVYNWDADHERMVALRMIPEPTTGTLSLLALCALAARRRRK